jgi:hypothetical protein
MEALLVSTELPIAEILPHVWQLRNALRQTLNEIVFLKSESAAVLKERNEARQMARLGPWVEDVKLRVQLAIDRDAAIKEHAALVEVHERIVGVLGFKPGSMDATGAVQAIQQLIIDLGTVIKACNAATIDAQQNHALALRALKWAKYDQASALIPSSTSEMKPTMTRIGGVNRTADLAAITEALLASTKPI